MKQIKALRKRQFINKCPICNHKLLSSSYKECNNKKSKTDHYFSFNKDLSWTIQLWSAGLVIEFFGPKKYKCWKGNLYENNALSIANYNAPNKQIVIQYSSPLEALELLFNDKITKTLLLL